LQHPVVSPHLPESRYPTLHRVFPRDIEAQLEQMMARRGPPFPEIHYLLLDRKDRKAYIARREQNLILLALAQPQEEDPHTLYVDELLMSPGTENYKVPPSEQYVEGVRRFLDDQLDVSENAR
jgi:hypothetical protein